MQGDVDTVQGRLEAYRALLRRDGPVPEIARLVELLESELGEPAGDRASAEPAARAR